LENAAAPKVEPPPTYKIEASSTGDWYEGKIYANGKLIKTQGYVSTFGYSYSYYEGEIGNQKQVVKNYTGVEAVKQSLIGSGKMQGFYVDGKFWPASDNIS
jgi:hypothetical protein